MFCKYSQAQTIILLTFDFQTASLAENTNQPIGVAFEGEQGAGKTPFVNGMLGLEIAYGNHRPARNIIAMTEGSFEPMHSTLLHHELGVVAWVDTGWEHLREANKDLFADNRNAFHAAHSNIPRTGVNIVENPERAQWDISLSYLYKAQVVARSIRKFTLCVTPECARREQFAEFVSDTRYLKPRPLI